VNPHKVPAALLSMCNGGAARGALARFRRDIAATSQRRHQQTEIMNVSSRSQRRNGPEL
jgi:hypothetical protein